MSEASTAEFERLLAFLRDERGFDFTGYKRSTLGRRVSKRMAEVQCADYAAYMEYLKQHADEFTALFNTILINVTSFFRDPEAWAALSSEYLPRLLERKHPADAVRIWTAGCASGQETYTLAMVLCEALGVEGFKERVKMYATDLDDDALAQARAAVYPPDELETVPEPLRKRYFEPVPAGLAFRADLRRLIIFGRHDLVRDAPISHLDLLTSRNTLMYFNADVQSRILNRFHFGLNEGGLLFLGKAEMIRSAATLFQPVNLKARIFTRVPRTNVREALLGLAHHRVPSNPDEQTLRQLHMCERALDSHPAAQVLVNGAGTVVLANAHARALFSIAPADVGRPLHELTISYRPVELRSLIDQVRAEKRPLHQENVEYPAAGGDIRHYDVHLQPLHDAEWASMGVSVTFVDVTTTQRLHSQLLETVQALETAGEELQSTNEELETTNEELQSTIEELETTNEELQSTNEELETMNEELQSTNEELETINDELERRSAELNDVNAYTESILGALRTAVVVVDEAQEVRVWNRRAEDLWGLRNTEVQGHAFQNLDIGLPVERLKAPLRVALDGKTEWDEVTLDAVNRRGRPFHCRVTITPRRGPGGLIRGVVLVMEDCDDTPGSAPARPSRDGAGAAE